MSGTTREQRTERGPQLEGSVCSTLRPHPSVCGARQSCVRDVGVCYANAFAVLLGPEDAEVPAGEAGELVVGGAGVAPGYASRGSMLQRGVTEGGRNRVLPVLGNGLRTTHSKTSNLA